MNFSAERPSRKWSYGGIRHGAAGMVIAGSAALSMLWPNDPAFALRKPAAALRHVPLPKPRPADAPVPEPEAGVNEPEPPAADSQAPEEKQPAGKTVPPAPPPSACRLALTDEVAIAPSVPDIHGAGGCGGEDLVQLQAVVLPDQHRVAVTPPAILRCAMAAAVADWVRTDIAPLAASLGSVISDLDNFDAFECRSRNRVVGAKLSEHGLANALDVRALKLANGRAIALTDRTVPRELRERVLQSVCARFSTVLGPGSDWYHEDHIHLDLTARRNDYRICQWNVWDPLPAVAPMLPLARPDEAPPREVAGKSDAANTADAPSGDSEPDGSEPETDRPAANHPTGSERSGETTKKRR